MSLAPGTRLGPYEIQAPVGAGGMGEVYRGRDTRLDRTVAIKRILPEYAADPRRRERFDREARSIARLTHPHIGALYDVGEQDGVHFLVMEFVEGETLAARLARGPIAIDEALIVATQIGDALAAAHRQGIVHRDLKPGNVMLTRAGAKLLDFGLAKLNESEAREAATRTVLTDERAVLGTLPYMAPEQLDGRSDERSDIFAFGAVLYEMLSGRRAFEGESQSGIMAALLACNPPAVSSLQPLVSPALERVVRKCLSRDPAARWQSVSDLADELRWVAGAPEPRAAAAPQSAWPARIAWAFAILAAAAAATLGVVWFTRIPPVVPESRLVMSLSAGLQLGVVSTPVAVSPDGHLIAFAANVGAGASQQSAGGAQLHVRPLDTMAARSLGLAGSAPFYSPDGLWLGFFSGNKLQRVSVSGGAAGEIAAGAGSGQGDWGSDDTIVFSDVGDRPIFGIRRVPAAGGTPEELTSIDGAAGETHHLTPQLLPDGRTLLYTIRSEGPKFRLAVKPLSGGTPRIVLEDAAFGRYIGDGLLLFQNGQSLFVSHVDESSWTATGRVPVLEGVRASANQPSWAFANGVLVYRPQGDDEREMLWVRRDGTAEPVGAPLRSYWNPRISPRGGRIATHLSEGGGTDVWTYEPGSGRLQRVTNDGVSRVPIWTPDETRLLIHRRTAKPDIFSVRADGSGTAEPITESGRSGGPAFTTKDGKVLVYHEVEEGGNYDLWMMGLDPGAKPRPLVQTPQLEAGARLHPSGQWMAYATNVTGRNDVFVIPFPDGGERIAVTIDGGREPVWSPDGRELFYRKDTKFFSVAITPGGRMTFEKPRVLFDEPYFVSGGPGNTQFDVAPDGRFLLMKNLDQPFPYLVVIQGWTARLKEMLRTAR